MNKMKTQASILVIGFLTLVVSGCRMPGGKLDPSPQPLDFGKVYVGTSASATAVWANNGANNATINGMLVDPTPTFSTTSPVPNETVNPAGNSSTFTFVFAPTSAGAATGTVTLIAGGVPPKKLNLKGEGVYQKSGTTASLTGGDLVKDEPLDFKEVTVGKTKTLSFSVKNSDPANAITVTPSWRNGGVPFAIAAGNVTVPSNGATNVTVSFTPAAIREYTDILEFTVTQNARNVAGTVVKGKGVQGG